MAEALTRPCKTCGEFFGKWRTQCPICGTPAAQILDPISHAPLKKRREKKDHKPKRPCALCQQGGANRTCVRCGALVHKGCRTFHEANCKGALMALIKCPQCDSTCRLPLVMSGRIRCGKCKRDFTPAELMKATPESPAQFNARGRAVTDEDFDLEQEDDGPFDDDDDNDLTDE